MGRALDRLRERYPDAQTFTFGDSRDLCEQLIALVRAGEKTATCGALRDFGDGGEEMPMVGRCDIALDWDGEPALVIETTDVSIMRFSEVPASFALKEGESDSLAGWRADHTAYFERNGGFDPEMHLVCEVFRVVEDLGN